MTAQTAVQAARPRRRILLVFEPPDGGVPEAMAHLALGLPALGCDVEVGGSGRGVHPPRAQHGRPPGYIAYPSAAVMAVLTWTPPR